MGPAELCDGAIAQRQHDPHELRLRRTAAELGLTEFGEVSEEKIWSNLEYFVKAVMPVAERAQVKMALHPDDPPRPSARPASP